MTTDAVRVDVSGAAALRDDQVKLGLWMFLATVTMLFAAFASAYIVRRSGSDWRPVALPSILWWNTVVLAASSVAVEIANWRGERGARALAAVAMVAALVLGVVFLGGQVEAWRLMRAAGVYLPTSPHSSFFFMLTGAHAVHVVAALAVLAWGAAGTVLVRERGRCAARMSLCRTFWHYLGAVWLFLFALLSLY
jgi:cytochrome c oxidase subunit 3